MTGVGKSSLVNRLVELLDFNNRHYRFDMGEISKNSNLNVKNQFKDLSLKKKPEPFIISFDEFQHARTIDEEKRELEKTDSRIIWKVLDSGKFDMDLADFFDLNRLTDLITRLEYSIKKGVKVVNGKVVENANLHYNNYHYFDNIKERKNRTLKGKDNEKNQPEEVLFVEEDYYSIIYDSVPELFEDHQSVEKKLKSMNENETLDFIKYCLEKTMQPTTIDCSLSLIFVIGNLDEAYKMSKEFTPEISADEFYRLSRKINITTIKKALQMRFRSEQIARLGNNHIIYPAFSSKAYRQIIQAELKRISKKVVNEHGITLSFEESVIKLIYNEGVYPTQGTRPVFSTIHQIINTKLSEIFTEIILHELNPDELNFEYNDGIMIVHCLKEGEVLDDFEIPQHLELGQLQKNRKDDQQAITAVHESGHAVLATVLMKSLPKVIYSVLSDAEQQGFMYSSYPWNYIARKEILPRVAVMLGGYAAEIVIFGDENLTAGASTDIELATEFLSDMFKKNGMGKETPVHYSISQLQDKAYHEINEVEEAIHSTIEKALNLALETLRQEKSFLLALSNYLADNRMIKKPGIKRIYQETGSKQIDLIEQGDSLFYRRHLKEQVEKNREESINQPKTQDISMNKYKY
jgi:hypothetical protein